MDKLFLLEDIRRHGHVIITKEFCEQFSMFIGREVSNSIDSMLLVGYGHSAISSCKFDIKVLEEWCKDNNLEISPYKIQEQMGSYIIMTTEYRNEHS